MNKQKILVTGADGFIGSHLTEELMKMGHEVHALSLYNSFNDIGWLSSLDLKSNVKVISGDIRDQNLCYNLTQNIDVIFHLAALIAIPYSYVAPDSYIDTNIKGTLNICQAAKKNNVKKLINVSTSEVYGTAIYTPIDENHPLQPQSPYSASKISAEAIAMSFYNSYDLNVTTVRPFNTYGPRQSARAIIPTIITQIASGKSSIQLGDLSPIRDFNYVKDTCEGLIAISDCNDSKGKIINIGSNTQYSISDILNIIQRLMNKSISVKVDTDRIRPEKSEVFHLICDNSLAKKLINYIPNETIETGLQKTIDWITEPSNFKLYNAEIYNI